MLRETWANTTDFNYSKFTSIHSQLNDTFLPINYPNWMKFSVNSMEKETKVI